MLGAAPDVFGPGVSEFPILPLAAAYVLMAVYIGWLAFSDMVCITHLIRARCTDSNLQESVTPMLRRTLSGLLIVLIHRMRLLTNSRCLCRHQHRDVLHGLLFRATRRGSKHVFLLLA